MKQLCPVCETACEEKATKCKTCKFEDELGINALWFSVEDAIEWLETVVIPHRIKWEVLEMRNYRTETLAKINSLQSEVEHLQKQLNEQITQQLNDQVAQKIERLKIELLEQQVETLETNIVQCVETLETNIVQCVETLNEHIVSEHKDPIDFYKDPMDFFSRLEAKPTIGITLVNPAIKINSGIKKYDRKFKFGGCDWLVLDVQKNKALLISEHALEKRMFHNKRESVTWAKCDIRKYLNDTFISKYFSQAEQSHIATTTIITPNNPWFGTDGGIATDDKVFLLSIEEVAQYFGVDKWQLQNGNPSSVMAFIDGDRTKEAMLDMTMGKGFWINDDCNGSRKIINDNGSAFWWWLRSSGHNPLHAANISHDGFLRVYGLYVDLAGAGGGGVRPALWLNL